MTDLRQKYEKYQDDYKRLRELDIKNRSQIEALTRQKEKLLDFRGSYDFNIPQKMLDLIHDEYPDLNNLIIDEDQLHDILINNEATEPFSALDDQLPNFFTPFYSDYEAESLEGFGDWTNSYVVFGKDDQYFQLNVTATVDEVDYDYHTMSHKDFEFEIVEVPKETMDSLYNIDKELQSLNKEQLVVHRDQAQVLDEFTAFQDEIKNSKLVEEEKAFRNSITDPASLTVLDYAEKNNIDTQFVRYGLHSHYTSYDDFMEPLFDPKIQLKIDDVFMRITEDHLNMVNPSLPDKLAVISKLEDNPKLNIPNEIIDLAYFKAKQNMMADIFNPLGDNFVEFPTNQASDYAVEMAGKYDVIPFTKVEQYTDYKLEDTILSKDDFKDLESLNIER